MAVMEPTTLCMCGHLRAMHMEADPEGMSEWEGPCHERGCSCNSYRPTPTIEQVVNEASASLPESTMPLLPTGAGVEVVTGRSLGCQHPDAGAEGHPVWYRTQGVPLPVCHLTDEALQGAYRILQSLARDMGSERMPAAMASMAITVVRLLTARGLAPDTLASLPLTGDRDDATSP